MVIPLDSVKPIPAGQAVTKVRIARIVTKARCGSNLLLGASWMDAGEETNTWSSRAENDIRSSAARFAGRAGEMPEVRQPI